MANRGKTLPARRPRGEESLLIRSAESLGRVIGSLQRQLEKGTAGAKAAVHIGDGDGSAPKRAAKRQSKSASPKATAANGRPSSRKKTETRKTYGKNPGKRR